jgi:hypothetical protein
MQGRVPDLAKLKMRHTMASPFRDFCDSASVMAADLALLPHTAKDSYS